MRSIFAFGLLLGAAGLAFAGDGQMAADAGQQRVQAAVDAQHSQAEPAVESVSEANCLRHTGSRIGLSKQRRQARTGTDGQTEAMPPCNHGVPGRAYTRDDLNRTGAIDLAEALRRLDPTIR